MISVLIGLALVIVAVTEWISAVSVIHAVAILSGVIGVLLVIEGYDPDWLRRKR